MSVLSHTLLIFHGSARESASNAAVAFAAELSSKRDCSDFSICFLKGAEPDLTLAITNAIAKGYKKLLLLPLFLLPGAHISEDIPAVVDKFKSSNPEVAFQVCDCLTHNPQFIEFVSNQIASVRD
ncbi:MAG: CbiX/SirB N-terminal domain-containing protein [Candidatus Riflebacteria bacterium]|nr:CbiX/SirB N-terminal domain-containing protein [Candidatus Riflebacteria bacterium]